MPLLEPDWSQRLERRSRATGPVIALFGFADRETVTLAKACGAIACLELPYDVDDLIDVIDRAAERSPPSGGRSRCASSNLIVCRRRRAGGRIAKQPAARYRGQIGRKPKWLVSCQTAVVHDPLMRRQLPPRVGGFLRAQLVCD